MRKTALNLIKKWNSKNVYKSRDIEDFLTRKTNLFHKKWIKISCKMKLLCIGRMKNFIDRETKKKKFKINVE